MNVATNITSGTLYATFQRANGDYWNGTGWEAYAGANWTTYDVAVTSEGAGVYSFTVPTDATDYQLRLQAGGSPAATDAVVDAGSVFLDASVASRLPTSSYTAAPSAATNAAAVRTELTTELARIDAEISSVSGGGGGTTIVGDVTYIGPVSETGTVTLYKGDANTLAWTISDYSGDVTDGAAIALRFLSIDSYNDASATTYNALLNKTATADLTDGTLTLSFTLSASDTNTLTAGANNDGSTKYRAQVIATGVNQTLVDVVATVRRRIGVAS